MHALYFHMDFTSKYINTFDKNQKINIYCNVIAEITKHFLAIKILKNWDKERNDRERSAWTSSVS
jgi:hypothetical protein